MGAEISVCFKLMAFIHNIDGIASCTSTWHLSTSDFLGRKVSFFYRLPEFARFFAWQPWLN